MVNARKLAGNRPDYGEGLYSGQSKLAEQGNAGKAFGTAGPLGSGPVVSGLRGQGHLLKAEVVFALDALAAELAVARPTNAAAYAERLRAYLDARPASYFGVQADSGLSLRLVGVS